jgi:predicted DNA-binding transcriptional regulator AlpA
MSIDLTSERSVCLLDEHDVARWLNLSVATIRRWRLRRQGPTYLKLGAAVRYRQQDLRDYVDGLAGAAPSTMEAA